MQTNHDDWVHPVPPIAYLRWKENYFFVILCREQNVYGICHINTEPGFDRMRFACALTVNGKQYVHKAEAPTPDDFGFSDRLTDGKMTMRVLQSHEAFELIVDEEDFRFDARFTARMPTFNFRACPYGAPENYAIKEAMTFGTNLQYEHLQQAMMIKGSLSLKGEGSEIELDGLGYRDHSWGMRTDNAVAWHTWSGLMFPGKTFGVITLQTSVRPELVCREGYVSDENGARVLRTIDLKEIGDRDKTGAPEKVVWDMMDVYGERYVIEADVGGRKGQVHHENEKANKAFGVTGYNCTENFCDLKLEGFDQPGFGLVELGYGTLKG